jgi:hypothetical protein
MAFWTSTIEPKRQYRFKVQVLGMGPDAATWYAKTVTKPGLEVGEGLHKYLGHTFHFPGSVTWSDVTVTLVDPAEPDGAAEILKILKAAGYDTPQEPGTSLKTVGKRDMVAAIKGVIITQLDSSGAAQETWELNNPIIKTIGLGDLSYDNEDLSTIEIVFAYDWCTFGSNQLESDLFEQGANGGSKSGG